SRSGPPCGVQPNPGAPAACIEARSRPSASASSRPSSTQRRARKPSSTAITSGTATASPSQRRPSASAAYSPGGAPARVLTNSRSPDSSSTAQASLMSPPATRWDEATGPSSSGSEIIEQPLAARLDQVENLLEAARSAVVRIGHVAPVEQQADLVLGSRRGDRAQVREVLAVHRDEQVELLEVRARHLPRRALEHDPSRPRGLGRPRIGCRARVPAAGAGALHLDLAVEAALVDQVAHDALGCRGAADVAHADEQDARFRA